MAKNCKHFNPISRCAVLLIIAAGASAAAQDMPAEEKAAANSAVQKVVENETTLRSQILADIETQIKFVDKYCITILLTFRINEFSSELKK